MKSKQDVLPSSLAPRGLSRDAAAAYIGVSTGTFQILVDDGRMPQPKLINSRLVWDRLAIDRAFDALPSRGGDQEGEAPLHFSV
jgi:hypothetical protein